VGTGCRASRCWTGRADLLVEQGAPRLHKAAHYARSALGVRDGVVLEGDAVSLFPHVELKVDVDAFDNAAAEARSGGTGQAAEAVQLYLGDLLPDDVYEPLAEEPREVRRLRHLELLRMLGLWERVLEADPLDEDAHLRLVNTHLADGDRHAALAHLHHLEEVLGRELGTGLCEAATELRDQAMVHPLGGQRWEQQAARRAPVPRPATPTVGREQHVADVLDLLDSHRATSVASRVLPTPPGPSSVTILRVSARPSRGPRRSPWVMGKTLRMSSVLSCPRVV
jgi:DNA-binding SARP family transcriptional activator